MRTILQVILRGVGAVAFVGVAASSMSSAALAGGPFPKVLTANTCPVSPVTEHDEKKCCFNGWAVVAFALTRAVYATTQNQETPRKGLGRLR
jgi:hypothetical protein